MGCPFLHRFSFIYEVLINAFNGPHQKTAVGGLGVVGGLRPIWSATVGGAACLGDRLPFSGRDKVEQPGLWASAGECAAPDRRP